MEGSRGVNIPIVVVLYDFRYMWRDNREISVKKGEKLLLLEKTNNDWWQVVRPSERKSFFVPAQYVEVLTKERQEREASESISGMSGDDSVLYENLDCLKQKINPSGLSRIPQSDVIGAKFNKDECGNTSQDDGRQKPVPKTRTKVSVSKDTDESIKTYKVNAVDSKRSYFQRIDSDNSDKSITEDKSKQDFASSAPIDSSAVHDSLRNYSKNTPVAVDNFVYCNVPVGIDKKKVKSSNFPSKVNIDTSKNRMKNSYNLKSKPPRSLSDLQSQAPIEFGDVKQCIPTKMDKLQFNQNFSKSLEKLAEEIQFEPKKVNSGSKISVDNYSKMKPVKSGKDNSEKKAEKRGKSNDASIVLDENKIQPHSRSMFSRFRRSLHHSNSFKSNNLKKLSKNSKKACELSLSWEGGLDKIQEKQSDEKLSVTPFGLQRSRTFMFAERSPLSVRPSNKIFSGKHRLDTAYHSQRKPDEKITLSTFKPIFNLDVTHGSVDPLEIRREKEFTNQPGLEKEKLPTDVSHSGKKTDEMSCTRKNEVDYTSNADANKSNKINMKKNPYENVTKVYKSSPVPENNLLHATESEGLTLYGEPFSNSESEDNLEEKSLILIANKTLTSQSSIDSNLSVSEASESDENGSLEFAMEKHRNLSHQPANKRRTSLVRSSRVESSKVRKVAARLPLTPPPDQKPMKDLGSGWGQYISKGGRSYYYNRKTGEKNWKPPRKTVAAQEVALVGSFESICSNANRSNTSSPLNENCHLLNSLNRSNGSLHSKSTTFENSSFETPKSGSISRWKEGSPDDLNRSSYNSSPVTGLSQSSGYSLNKSSRDSLNRFSPIDNIPSEEESFELSDHVYKNDIPNRKKGDPKQEEGRKSSKDSIDVSTFRIKPGWDEFYDENLDQIYYVHKDRKEKWILSFDSEERAYFFEETSKKSLWALPDYSNAGENSKVDSGFSLQKSATETGINSESSWTKLRQNKDGDNSGRISTSSRSSKAQSMLIEPKFDLPSNNGSKTFSMPRDLSKVYGEILRFGVLNKTKISENGKKLRKNWTPAFVVLTESCLFFFKDAKSFQNMKNVITSSSNYMCLSLQGAVIDKGDKISSRKNVYKIGCTDNTEVLIQSEKTAEADEWFKEINAVIQNLPEKPSADSGSPLLDVNSPSKVGRTKSLKVRNKETGSMEDLSSTPEDRQNKIKAKLKKFFIRRPTVDSLKKKGIWKDEPVFGCSLEQITKNRNPRVPVFVEKCIECIESKEENMKTDGLYRASGNLSQVQKIRLEVDQNNLSIMKDEEDVHVLTGSLKLFFRELKEPLIPSKQLEPALLATDKQIRKERIKDFQKIVKSLPTPNYDTLKFLLQHLLRVKAYHKFNRMNINNLAIVFGPTLMWPEQESANIALELMQQNVVIECLLKEFQEIFT